MFLKHVIAIIFLLYPLLHAMDNYLPIMQLHNGIERNKINIIEKALKRGAPVDEPFKLKKEKSPITPLLRAILRKNKDIVALLVARGAKLNKSTISSVTPLMGAINCSSEIACFLIDKGADVNCAWGRFSPLYFAVSRQNLDIDLIIKLVNAGAKIDGLQIDATSPLVEAAYKQHSLILHYFLLLGVPIENTMHYVRSDIKHNKDYSQKTASPDWAVYYQERLENCVESIKLLRTTFIFQQSQKKKAIVLQAIDQAQEKAKAEPGNLTKNEQFFITLANRLPKDILKHIIRYVPINIIDDYTATSVKKSIKSSDAFDVTMKIIKKNNE